MVFRQLGWQMDVKFGVDTTAFKQFQAGSWVQLRAVGSGSSMEVRADANDVEVGRNDEGQLVVRRLDVVRERERRQREDKTLRGTDRVD